MQKSKGIPILTSGSNILVGLGVFGTFLGLTIGVSGFDTTSSNAIKDSIQGLLSGMGSAFLTSLWGMILSIVMTIFEKYQIGRLQITLHKLCYEIDSKYKFNKKDEQIVNEEQMKMLYDSYFIYEDEQGNRIPMAKLLHSNYIAVDEMKGAMKSFSSDLAVKIDAGFESILQSESLQEILPALHSVKMEISKLGSDMKSPATDMVDKAIGELGIAVKQLMSDMQKSVSDSTEQNLTHITDLLVSSSQALMELPSSLNQMTKDLNNSFDQMKVKINEASEQTYAQNKDSVETSQMMMLNTAEQMSKQFELMTSNLSNTFNTIGDKLDQISNESTTKSKEAFNEFHSLIQETTKASNDQVNLNQVKQSELLNEQQETIKSLNILTSKFQESIKNMTLVNTAVGSTIKMTADLQADVTNSCNRLAGFSDVIKRSSENFLLSQEQFRKYSDEFMNNNTNLVDELQKLISDSVNGTSKNVEKYSTINEGIEGIFSKIQEGLIQYQRTIEDGVKNSLNSFSEALTSSSEALSSAAITHNDMLDELISTFEKIKR
ncbi:MAG: hypothetical protein ACRC6V_02825 [Bacteroidales bacterium]